MSDFVVLPRWDARLKYNVRMKVQNDVFQSQLCLSHAGILTIVLCALAATPFKEAHAAQSAPHKRSSLVQARAGFVTHLTTNKKTTDPVPTPPAGVLSLVNYPAPLGNFPAYISAPPTTDKRYPAIVWIAGGFDNGIGDTPWTPQEADNDQSASAFREAGIVTMYPSLRGGNNNPGYIESFYGEVEDVLAAAKYLAQQPFVDPKRIYLGGHSTGGTLVLLADESTDLFRAVFSFGPVARASEYDDASLTFDSSNEMENRLRSPISFLDAITSPTYVIEGTADPSNIAAVNELEAANSNPRIHFIPIDDQTHFSELAISTPMVAKWITGDSGPYFRIGAADNTPAQTTAKKVIKKKAKRH
ncbi:hypothetical protein CCAX7_44830 [Capsulimonas corticalis]|uniref:Peptidase S9 prolyl oligopeptidase catalytic domain-containing protein n=1 Tax=Capsulimonas corticalis TaxID=2219043 RepID=A0A402CX13_9BACT|nr:prolyl oligopeptidase family serine peptidase [Capsulimonas corticalis]BDI32432.1 hypothetical protein CCAX7_44830 [Capsulimonas corticalis]